MSEIFGVIEQKVNGILLEKTIQLAVISSGITINNYSGGGGSALPVSVNFTNQTSVHVLHNRGIKPQVSIFDAFGNFVHSTVNHPNVNEFYVTFAAAQSGSLSYF